MKKLLAALLCLCLLFSLAGCGTSPDNGKPDGTNPSGDVILPSPSEPFHPDHLDLPMHAIALPAISQATAADDGTVIFTRSYQQIQLILNGKDIEGVITADLKKRMNNALADAELIEEYAREDYPDTEYWNPYFMNISYTPTRIDQAVLSLFCNYSTYSGGSHPSVATESVTYDLVTGDALLLGDILVENYSGMELSNLIGSVLSANADELYYDYQSILQDLFRVNLNGIQNWYFSRSGLCFHFAPYEIAPYSSGTITATIPYGELSGVLRDQYLPMPIPNATGSMYAETFLQADTERFTFLADVVLDADGTEILLHPDATVTDVRLEIGTWISDGTRYNPTATVFAAGSVGLGNGIHLKADLSAGAPALRLVYRSGDQEVSAFIVYDETGDTILLSHG